MLIDAATPPRYFSPTPLCPFAAVRRRLRDTRFEMVTSDICLRHAAFHATPTAHEFHLILRQPLPFVVRYDTPLLPSSRFIAHAIPHDAHLLPVVLLRCLRDEAAAAERWLSLDIVAFSPSQPADSPTTRFDVAHHAAV